MATAELVDIATACSRRGLLCVLGVVVDRLDVYRTKGSSSCVTFTIKDSQFDAPSWQGGLKIKYFNDDESKLPDVCLNDVVLLRDIRVSRPKQRDIPSSCIDAFISRSHFTKIKLRVFVHRTTMSPGRSFGQSLTRTRACPSPLGLSPSNSNHWKGDLRWRS